MSVMIPLITDFKGKLLHLICNENSSFPLSPPSFTKLSLIKYS